MKHKHADLMIAYANDSSLKFERQHPDGYWFDGGPNPAFNPDVNYRIKPEPKKAYVLMYTKQGGRWIPMSYDAGKDAQNYYEELLKFGYDVTDIKEVEWK